MINGVSIVSEHMKNKKFYIQMKHFQRKINDFVQLYFKCEEIMEFLHFFFVQMM